MPGLEESAAMGVEEGYNGGNFSVVVVDDVGEVRHGLVAFVDGCFQECGGVVR